MAKSRSSQLLVLAAVLVGLVPVVFGLIRAISTGDDVRYPRTQVGIDTVEGPVLVIRSAPWPVLRALLARLATNELAREITVLCHRRDESALAALSAPGAGLGLEILPLFYPRFETFNTSTLRRVLSGGAWRTTFVLDASRTGRGDSLEHVTTACHHRTPTYGTLAHDVATEDAP